MSDIRLPPLPEGHNADGWGGRDTGPWLHTTDELRARDLEVARVALEAAATLAAKYGNRAASEIRAMKVSHE